MMRFRRGLRRILEFTVDDTVGEIGTCKITFAQKGETVLTKTLNKDAGMILNGNVLRLRLNADETLLFEPNEKVQVQVLLKYKNGYGDATNIENILALDTLGREVIS